MKTILTVLLGNRDGEQSRLADALAASIRAMRHRFRVELAALPPHERAKIIRGLPDTPPPRLVVEQPPPLPPMRPFTPRR